MAIEKDRLPRESTGEVDDQIVGVGTGGAGRAVLKDSGLGKLLREEVFEKRSQPGFFAGGAVDATQGGEKLGKTLAVDIHIMHLYLLVAIPNEIALL
jgi:hypothetical protein